MKTKIYIKNNYSWLLLVIYVITRLFLININFAEIGDSNNFLLLADQINKGIFPAFTNRLPMYPLLLSVGIRFMDGYLWGRILSLLFSIGILIMLYKITNLLFDRREIAVLACALTVLNPIFTHDSLRVYSEVVLVFFVLCSFYFFFRENERSDFIYIGIFTILAVMTRFEGFILLPVFLISYALRRKWMKLVYYLLICIVPFAAIWMLIYFKSGILPSRFLEGLALIFRPRLYDLVPTYITNLLFMSGFPILIFWTIFGFAGFFRSFKKFAPLVLFVLFDLFVIYKVHPGTRYFNVLVPIFSIAISSVLIMQFHKNKLAFAGISAVSIILFVLLGLKEKSFFVFGTIYSSFITLLLSLAVFLVYLLFKHQSENRIVRYLVLSIVLISLFNLSSSIIWYRRYDYYTIAQASRYLANKSEKVAYFDESGVSAWFLRKNGVYFNQELSEDEQLVWLKENNIKYAIWTNEYNENGELTVLKSKEFYNNFKLIKSFNLYKQQWLAVILENYGFIREKYLPVSKLYTSEIYEVKY